MAEVPTLTDRLRLINRAQRWTVAQIAVLSAEDLDPDVRALLEEASAIYLRGGRRCEEIIAALDRDRELPSRGGMRACPPAPRSRGAAVPTRLRTGHAA